MTKKTERQLVIQAQRDPEAFGKLFDHYYQPIYNYILRRVGDTATAGDICSNVFFKAYKKLWQFKWRGYRFSSWLYKIASNEIKTYYRQSRYQVSSLEDLREISGFEPQDVTDIEQEMIEAQEKYERHQQFISIQGSIKHLDNKYQEVIHLRFFENKKIREIGDILGKKQGTIKSLLSRGITKLRRRHTQNESISINTKPKLQPLQVPNVISLKT